MAAEPSQQTQPATQQVLDPRRLGRNNSGLSSSDISDVLVILHPATPTAIKIVEQSARYRPEHVLFRNSLGSISASITDPEEQETFILNPPTERTGPSSRAGADLALRLSSAKRLKQKELGFVFGRNHQSSDIIFGQDSGRRISNQHFRIYLNFDGLLMIEDMSTNGTIVDDALLKCKLDGWPKIRMLSSGSIICIQSTHDAEMIKFIIRIPSRTTHIERFRENLRNFISECTPGIGEEQSKMLQRVTKQYGGPAMKWDGGEHYNIISQIGKGAFATVYQLATKMTGKLLAAKELEKRRFMKNGMLDKKIDNEMKIMQGLRHPNIVEFIEYYDQGDFLYIIMEFVRQGDLQGHLNQHGKMKEETARSMAQQILGALHYLHKAQITHRDIKPDNILIADLNPFTVKLSDFGLSKVVKHEETFLKTFCGTLLYCAPEVFPDFNGHSKGTKRRRGAKTYHSYSSSVDIWSFGGVLWYSLCGEPPFKGIADATGEAMYRNIMGTPLDPTPLKKAGVSVACIDLLMRMLRTDPAERPDDRECLNHPWLKEGATIPADPTLQSIVEEEEEEEAEQQLSQLSIGAAQVQGSDEEDDILSDEEIMGFVTERRPKRVRADPLYPRDQVRDRDDSSVEPSFTSSHRYNDESFRVMPTPRQPRLFGEIGQSALQSSGILNAHANDALSQEDSVQHAQNDGAADPRSFIDEFDYGGPFTAPAKLERGISSPSLLGAESLVRDLNMTSPHSPISRTQSPVMPATPRTPEVVQHRSLGQSSKEFSQVSEPTPRARPSGMDRQIKLPLTASYYYDPIDPSTHNLEYASRVSGFDFVSRGHQTASSQVSVYPDTTAASEASTHSTQSSVVVASSPAAEVVSVAPELDIRPPPRRLGKLIATPDSFIPTLVLPLDQSKTSWGRHADNTIVYENSQDTRVPKTAFNIFFYSPDSRPQETVEELSQQGKDWTSLDNLKVGISTCATHGISINGERLYKMDENDRAQFGHLHTGDIVQVSKGSEGNGCLKFRCEFYIGVGKDPRPAGHSFSVRVGQQFS
ncbi:meiosis-specific serine threonine- kinase mek1 [Pyrenophora seminiperda CCB06]|uniref:Autophagy-related protein 1 n=1 Tax=Pyrenophora seminiperda CCB06 TaxID=1302712 RepID=A0A3M7LX58_9PLEO|nr:meiosis-specific serine threonine- kinase mek1 [Pyrenophora seminiperda CCB06]